MTDLEIARAEIDAADREISAAFCRRMDAVLQIGAYKKAHGMAVYQPEREKAVLAKVKGMASKEEYADALGKLYETMFQLAKALQEEV